MSKTLLPTKSGEISTIMGISLEEFKKMPERKEIKELFEEYNREERNISQVIDIVTRMYFSNESEGISELVDYLSSL